MNINLIAIDANKTIGKNPVLVDVAPAYVYENGKRTGEVSGFKYTVALPDKAFEKLTIKIDGATRFLQRRRIFVLSMRERLKLHQISLCMVCLKHTVQRLCDRGSITPIVAM